MPGGPAPPPGPALQPLPSRHRCRRLPRRLRQLPQALPPPAMLPTAALPRSGALPLGFQPAAASSASWHQLLGSRPPLLRRHPSRTPLPPPGQRRRRARAPPPCGQPTPTRQRRQRQQQRSASPPPPLRRCLLSQLLPRLPPLRLRPCAAAGTPAGEQRGRCMDVEVSGPWLQTGSNAVARATATCCSRCQCRAQGRRRGRGPDEGRASGMRAAVSCRRGGRAGRQAGGCAPQPGAPVAGSAQLLPASGHPCLLPGAAPHPLWAGLPAPVPAACRPRRARGRSAAASSWPAARPARAATPACAG